MTDSTQTQVVTREPFWLFDREAKELVRRDGHGGIYLANCDNNADILGYILEAARSEAPMPVGGFEDLVAAFREIFGGEVMRELESASAGAEISLLRLLDVDCMEDYLDTVAVSPTRLKMD